MELHKLNKSSVVQQVIDCLTDAIIRKELRPGEQIPTEQALSDKLGVSRNSVREAIKILVFIGVLEIRRPEGTFVCDGFSEKMINPMIYGIIMQNDSYESLMDLREMIEVGVLRLAQKKADVHAIKTLKKQLEQLKAICLQPSPDINQVFEADNRFHDAIDLCCGNEVVTRINNITRILTHQLRYNTVEAMFHAGRNQEFIEAHAQIYNIICSKSLENLNEMIRRTYFLDVFHPDKEQ